MRKLIVCVFVSFLALSQAMANDADLFKFDYNSVQAEFAELNQLAELVTANTSLTYTELKYSNESLITSMNLVPETGIPGGASGEPVLGIPSFLWGCGLGVVGMVIVYIGTDQDKDETKKALWGCITSGAVYSVVYIVYYVAVLSAVSAI
jgi:hypothetical protein